MLRFQYLNLLSRNPNSSNLFSVQVSINLSRPITSHFLSCVCTQSLMASNTKIVVEYAKSNRSSCKKCTNSISVNTLRLGLHSKDPRGYEVTKWHHLNCFPTDSQPIVSVEKIEGFSSLKSSDQEALEKLTSGCGSLPKEDSDGEKEKVEGSHQKSAKDSKVGKPDEAAVDEHEEKKFKIIAEYAKSNRSSCKKCAINIPAKTLRLGLVSSDRGFDMTKWHHLKCFPTDPLPIDSVDEINGFLSLKSSDQEALKKLMDGEQLPIQVLKYDEDALNELQDSKSKKSKASKIVAEYAKSNRSSCKKCTEAISAKSLRLGLVSKDRGYDMTKWYHLDCFPTDSQPNISLDEIDGLLSLEISDRDALKKLVDGCEGLPKEDYKGEEDMVEGSDEKSLSDCRVRKANAAALDELEESKKLKVAELDIAFSTSDVKNNYKEATLSLKWKAFQTVIFLERDEGLRDSEKIAAFDFDGCLANTNVKRVGPDAWSLMHPSIPEKLKSLYDNGYKLVIFTNESNIERWKNKRQVAIDSKIGRLNNFINRVKVPIQVFIACGLGKSDGKEEDPFRKPKPGMWRLMEQQFNSGITIDMDQSFYVGDAAGRNNDHSDADLKFAQGIGLKFHVPEEYFGAGGKV